MRNTQHHTSSSTDASSLHQPSLFSSIPVQQSNAQAHASGLVERDESAEEAPAKLAPTHSRKHHEQMHTQPGQQTSPASCRNPASWHAQQMQRTGTRDGLAGAERAKTHSRSTRTPPSSIVASQHRSIAASLGEAAERQR